MRDAQLWYSHAVSDGAPESVSEQPSAGAEPAGAETPGGNLSQTGTATPAVPPAPPLADRVMALAEVVLCSGFPTQLAIGGALGALGFHPLDPSGRLSATWVAVVSLLDTAAVVGLVFSFLRLHGEPPRLVLLGRRAVGREALLGLPLVVAAFVLVVVVISLVRELVPSLHNVERNPMQDLIRSPADAWAFAIVGIVGGGLREEIQRAFVLRRFERYLGGAWIGLVLFSLAFGAGHAIQGWDVTIATASLGVLWGLVYLRRRSIAAPFVSHAGFNAAEVFRYTFFSLPA